MGNIFEAGVSTEEERNRTLRPLRFLGMGMLIAWLCCTHVPDIYCGESDVLRRVASTGMRYGDIGVFLLLAACASRIGSLGSHMKIAGVLVVACCVGTALTGLILVPIGAPVEVVMTASAATALGGAILFCLWAEVYSQMGSTQIVVYGAGSCLVAFGLYVLVSTMMHPYAVLATALLPVGSFACVASSFVLVPREVARSKAARYAVPWKIVAIMALAGFASGLAGSVLLNPDGQGAVHRIWATGVAGAVILGLALLRPEKFDARFLAQACVPLALAACVLMPAAWSNAGFAVSFLVKLAYVWFTIFALMLLANLAFRFGVPTLRMFAIARACSEGAIFLGVTMRGFLQSSGLSQDGTVLLISACAGVVAVCVCVLLWRSERAVNADWGAAGIEVASGERVMGPRERLIVRCEQLAQMHALTARETEVLTLIAQRKTRSEIEQELFLSQNTVKTHVRHIYAKLGIHSKSDVYELVGQ
ncbi:helix-turn-helix transcriptional regulator [Slackia piriformis]